MFAGVRFAVAHYAWFGEGEDANALRMSDERKERKKDVKSTSDANMAAYKVSRNIMSQSAFTCIAGSIRSFRAGQLYSPAAVCFQDASPPPVDAINKLRASSGNILLRCPGNATKIEFTAI